MLLHLVVFSIVQNILFLRFLLMEEFLVTSSKRCHKVSIKNSKCAISKNAHWQNQDGRPDRYWKLKQIMEKSAENTPYPA